MDDAARDDLEISVPVARDGATVPEEAPARGRRR